MRACACVPAACLSLRARLSVSACVRVRACACVRACAPEHACVPEPACLSACMQARPLGICVRLGRERWGLCACRATRSVCKVVTCACVRPLLVIPGSAPPARIHMSTRTLPRTLHAHAPAHALSSRAHTELRRAFGCAAAYHLPGLLRARLRSSRPQPLPRLRPAKRTTCLHRCVRRSRWRSGLRKRRRGTRRACGGRSCRRRGGLRPLRAREREGCELVHEPCRQRGPCECSRQFDASA